MRIPFATASSQARSAPVSTQRLVNLFTETQPPDAKAPGVLYGTPGMRLYTTCGVGPVHAMAPMGDALLVVSGDGLYRVKDGGAVERLGDVTATAPVTIAVSDTQALIGGGGAADVWDGEEVASLSSEGFPGAAAVGYLDGYGLYVEPRSGRFGITDLADFRTVNALDFATAESSPDRLVTLVVDHREVWLIGERTIEIWTNTGNADFPFERLSGAIIERGCAAAGSVARLDGGVFWLADDGLVYRAQQYQPQRISTHAVERAIAEWGDVSDVTALAYQQDGHAFYALTSPSARATWVYDVASGLWHERSSNGGRWRASCAVRAFGRVLVGDSRSGAIAVLDMDEPTELGAGIARLAQSPPVHAAGKRAIARHVEIEAEMGVGLTTGQGADPQMALQWSDDGGRTWSAEYWRPLGPKGAYRQRAVWHRGGMFRERSYRLTITDPVRVAIIAANLEIEQVAS